MDHLTIKEILQDYYKKNGFDSDGGESKASVKVILFKGLTIYLPNNETRKKVILLHDIHHMLTGYSTVMKGEIEISTWELSTGCTNNWVAFTLNSYAMAIGFIFNLKGIWKAWLRGKNTRNLYNAGYSKRQLMNKTMTDLKKELGFLDEDIRNEGSFSILLSFVSFLVLSLIISIISVILIPVILIYSLIIFLQNR
jgi:hypothetical protein